MKPLVVIVGRRSDEAQGVRGKPFAAGQSYFRSVERAGGIPLMLPPIPGLVDDIPSLLRRSDAVVFHGGGDIDPRRYGQQAIEESLYGIVPEHDAMELAMVAAAIEADKPVLAICRGLQVLNVALGGTLVQDIGSEDHWLRFTRYRTRCRLADREGDGYRVAAAMSLRAPPSPRPSSVTACTSWVAIPAESSTRSNSSPRDGSSASNGTPKTPPPKTPNNKASSTN